VQSRDVNHAQLSTLFWVNTVFGFLVWASCAALGPAVATAAVAGAFYVSHKGLEGWEQRLKSDTKEQVQFLRHLDQAQEKLTGVPAQPWLFF
jgi:hypothetical protein